MSAPDVASSLSRVPTAEVTQIRAVLDVAGYSEAHILQLLGVEELPTPRQRRQSLPLYLWRTREETPLTTLVRLFFLQQSIPLASVRQAVEPMSVQQWETAGLVYLTGDMVEATVELCPYRDLLAAADWSRPLQDPDPYQVMGITASSRTLAQMAIRRPIPQTLDLGTGCGLLAFLAARYSEHVIAVDRNPHALLMARFNAQLNGLTNIEWREGDWFTPLSNQQFALIVCNPPFVIAPNQVAVHSHSGLPLDQLCQTLVRTAPLFLQEGGYCQLLCNWVQIAGQDWRERLASWIEGIACDVWVLHAHSEDIAEYALRRINETTESAEQATSRFREWMDYYTHEKIEAVGFGVITLRRSSRSMHWFRCDRLPEVKGLCGEAIEQGFRLHDFLDSHQNDQELLSTRVSHAANLQWEQHQQLVARGWVPNMSRLQLTSGLLYSGNADANVVDFVSRCKGDLRLREHLKRFAKAAGQTPDRLAPGFLKVVRRLIELGCLLPMQ
ncbi:MAG: methyltransferase [Candidatus Binatia bacterium]